MNLTKSECGCVNVIHGANDGTFALEGAKVLTVRSSLVDAFNIPKDAIAFVNGEQVDMGYTLATDDTLEFCKQAGRKGINRPFTKEDILSKYAGYPEVVFDDLFRSFRHHDANGRGEPIWIEELIDKWLTNRYANRVADDGRDKVIPPSSVRIAGHIVNGLTTTEWKILKSVLSRSTADKPGVSFDEVIEDGWEHDAGWKDEALKQQIKNINKKFSVQRSRASVHIKNRFVTISK